MDQNLPEIAKKAREAGLRVNIRNDDLADLDVQDQDGFVTEIWECKNGDGGFTKRQIKMRKLGWKIRTVRTEADVLQARSEMTRAASAIQRTKLGD